MCFLNTSFHLTDCIHKRRIVFNSFFPRVTVKNIWSTCKKQQHESQSEIQTETKGKAHWANVHMLGLEPADPLKLTDRSFNARTCTGEKLNLPSDAVKNLTLIHKQGCLYLRGCCCTSQQVHGKSSSTNLIKKGKITIKKTYIHILSQL